MLTRPADSRALSVQEGLIIGVIGASLVAVCYFVADVIRGIPLLTPSVLGEVILFHREAPSLEPDLGIVAVYTIFHIAVFCVFGIALAAVAGWARTNAVARYGIVQMFIAFVVFALGGLTFMSDATRGLFPMILVLAANLLAAAGMAWWLWIQHPSLRAALRGNDLGGSDKRDITNAPPLGSQHPRLVR